MEDLGELNIQVQFDEAQFTRLMSNAGRMVSGGGAGGRSGGGGAAGAAAGGLAGFAGQSRLGGFAARAASLGAIAGPPAIAIASLVLLAKASKAVADRFNRLKSSLLTDAARIAPFNGQIFGAQLDRTIGDLRRTFDRANFVAPQFSRLIRAQNRLENAMAPLKNAIDGVRADLVGRVTNSLANFVTAAGALFGGGLTVGIGVADQIAGNLGGTPLAFLVPLFEQISQHLRSMQKQLQEANDRQSAAGNQNQRFIDDLIHLTNNGSRDLLEFDGGAFRLAPGPRFGDNGSLHP